MYVTAWLLHEEPRRRPRWVKIHIPPFPCNSPSRTWDIGPRRSRITGFRPTSANAFRLNRFPGRKLRLSLRREGGKKIHPRLLDSPVLCCLAPGRPEHHTVTILLKKKKRFRVTKGADAAPFSVPFFSRLPRRTAWESALERLDERPRLTQATPSESIVAGAKGKRSRPRVGCRPRAARVARPTRKSRRPRWTPGSRRTAIDAVGTAPIRRRWPSLGPRDATPCARRCF